MKTIFKAIFSAFIFMGAIGFILNTASSAFSDSRGGMLTYFILGFDDAAENTDVMLTLTYDSLNNSIRIIQIPRDTYVSYDDYEGRINGFFPRRISEGASPSDVLPVLTERISNLLGIGIDGYIGFTHSGFVNAVDSIGGVDIPLPCGYDNLFAREEIESGGVHLDGETAYSFVRYRQGYLRADIDRMDAQKVFIKAVFSKVMQRNDVLTLFFDIAKDEGIFYDFSRARAIALFSQNIFKLKKAELITLTLPGEAKQKNGVWLYFVNRERADSLFKSYFSEEYYGLDVDKHFVYN